MLAYAPRPERRRFSPTALSVILGAHALAILAVMSAKMEIIRHKVPPTIVELIPNQPEPAPPEPHPKQQPAKKTLTAPTPPLPLPPHSGPAADPLSPEPLPPLLPGTGAGTAPELPKPLPINRTGPRFATPAEDVRPPYPESMRALEKEAVLRLKLSIDERGRVTAVEPVGRPEPAFLAAARRHIMKAWRYSPAKEGERAIASTTVITLKFELD